jgi:hypothetical protein
MNGYLMETNRKTSWMHRNYWIWDLANYQKHYALLLGVGSPWEVKNVELKLGEKKVEIELGWQWDLHLKVARAWGAKELFSEFWEYQEKGWALRFFKQWFSWVSR